MAKEKKLTKIQRSDKIMDAAIYEFATRGYANAKLSNIAERAGVSYGLVSARFGSKEELLCASLFVITDIFDKAEHMEGDVYDRLACVINLIREYASGSSIEFNYCLNVLTGKDIPECVNNILWNYFTTNTAITILGDAMEKGIVAKDDPYSFIRNVMVLALQVFDNDRKFGHDFRTNEEIFRIIIINDKTRYRIDERFNYDVADKRMQIYDDFIKLINKRYISAQYYNIDTDEEEIVKLNAKIDGVTYAKRGFRKGFLEYIDNYVAKGDKKRLRDMIKPELLKSALKERDSISTNYTQIIAGKEQYIMLQISRGLDEDHAIAVFTDVTDTVLAQRANEKKLKSQEDKNAELLRDEAAYQRAILAKADSYWKINLTKNRVIGEVNESESNNPIDLQKYIDKSLVDYDSGIRIWSSELVDREYRSEFRNKMSTEYLIAQFHKRNRIPEVVAREKLNGIDWIYRRYVAYLSEDEKTGDIYAMMVAYDVTEDVIAEKENEAKEEGIRGLIETLYQIEDVERAIERMLAIVCNYHRADRAYLFEFNKERTEALYRYEWCKRGIKSSKPNIDRVPFEYLAGWFLIFENEGELRIDDIHKILDKRTGLYKTLCEEGVNGVLAVPIIMEGVIVGYLGLDNPKRRLDETIVLKISAALSYSEILRRKQNDEEHIVSDRIYQSFKSVYYVDFITDYIAVHTANEKKKEEFCRNKSYAEFVDGYSREYISENNLARCRVMLAPEYIMEQFKHQDMVVVDYVYEKNKKRKNIALRFIKANSAGTAAVICEIDNTDVVAREHEVARRLDNARKAAEAANEAKSRFLFNMSHDIRTPMNAIIGFTNLAEQNIENKEMASEYLEKVRSANSYLMTLVDDVLDMARIESGQLQFDEAVCDIRSNAKELIGLFAQDAEQKNITLTLDLRSVKHNNIWADKARVRQIMINIVSNAVKYTYEGGRIKFSIAEEESKKPGYARYVFKVIDNGIGMSKEFLTRIYNQFERANNSTVSKVKGTGLGMAIVKRLVDMMGGTIKIDSTEGKGTRVMLAFDFKVAEITAEEYVKEREQEASPEFLSGKKVLLVEDNHLNIEIMKHILMNFGMEVTIAEDGTDAVKVIRNAEPNDFDIILMDIQMPTMNGYEATKKIRALKRDISKIPIVAMTANAFEEDKKAAIDAGMNGHIAKPIKVKELVKTMRKALDDTKA